MTQPAANTRGAVQALAATLDKVTAIAKSTQEAARAASAAAGAQREQAAPVQLEAGDAGNRAA